MKLRSKLVDPLEQIDIVSKSTEYYFLKDCVAFYLAISSWNMRFETKKLKELNSADNFVAVSLYSSCRLHVVCN